MVFNGSFSRHLYRKIYEKYKIGKIDFCIIWDLGGSSGVQNTPMGCGNNFHTRQNISENSLFLDFLYFLEFTPRGIYLLLFF